MDPPSPSQINFRFLTPKILDFLKDSSTCGLIGYFETEYFGGDGEQGAILARLGEITFGPRVGAGSINQMLNQLGVRRKGSRDEFDTIGLGRCRDNQGWIENQTSVKQPTETMTLTGSLISWIHGLGKK